jgi:hypothetical protein
MKNKLLAALLITAIFISGCAKTVTSGDVLAAFKAAGLEETHITSMTRTDYALTPYVCDGTQFLISSLGTDTGGKIFICDKAADLDKLNQYYTALNQTSDLLRSWVFIKGSVLVQINGSLPEAKARQYQAAIP